MGAFNSKTEQDLKRYLDRDYDITHYPTIIHKLHNNKALVHQIVTDSAEQAYQIRSDVNMYHHLKCESISKVLQYIPLQTDKICSEQEYHYIVEEDLHKYNLKQQFLSRKYYKQKFSDHQILSILRTYLCGLSIYYQKFHRRFGDSLGLQSITVDQQHKNQLRLVDPRLKGQTNLFSMPSKQNQSSSYRNKDESMVLIREAPEKQMLRKTQFNEDPIQFNEFLADLYKVGIICLQLHRMELFNNYEKSDIIKSSISSISNRQMKKAVEIMTNHNPLQRSHVYEVVKSSIQEKYLLQKNLKRGKINQQPVSSAATKQNKLLNPNEVKRGQKSFSFGNDLPEHSHHYPMTQSFGLNSGYQRQTYQLAGVDKNKTNTISNLSTDRSLHQNTGNTGVITSSLSNYEVHNHNKPTIKFVSGSNSSSNNFERPKILSSSSSNNLYHQPQQNINLYQNSSASLLAKSQEPVRNNSYLYIEHHEKPLFKETDYSPFKKQQDISPLSQKGDQRRSADGNGYKQIFQKYSYLNFQTKPGYSPGKSAQNDKMEAEINRLLRESINKPQQNITETDINPSKNDANNKNLLNSNKYTPSPLLNRVDSPISALQPGANANSFASRQNTFIKSTNIIQNGTINSQIPAYRPNKQVQQILKRLGIGSLLYGNGQSNGEKEQNFTYLKKQSQLPNSQVNKQDLFVHKVSYTINKANISQPNDIHEKLEQNKQKNLHLQNAKNLLIPDENDIHERQTTPIRRVNKAKYNSTIVEVGDEDSQYSSSGVRNLENFNEQDIDLTNHQFVNQQYETGSRYEGYKLNGQRNGYGKFFYQDGGYYEGQWKNNKMDGFGRLYYEGGKLAYEGHWAKDEFHGFGKVYNDNPVKLQCGFDFTNFDLLEDYWEYYEGTLVKDTKEGRGKIKLTNEQVFEGDFHNDRIQGFGKFFLREGNMIEGIWRDSKLIKIIN